MRKRRTNIFILYLLILLCLFSLTGCYKTTEITAEESPPIQAVRANAFSLMAFHSNNIPNANHTLPRSFEFYKGSISMSKIKTIEFSRNAPNSYDECWNANLTNTETIKGYRIGTNVIIVGDYIYANPSCSYMFAAYSKYQFSLWSNLISIKGLELLDTSYVKNMNMMFRGGNFLQLNGIENWDTSNVTSMAGTFSKCTKLTSLDIASWDVSNVTTFCGMFAGNDWVGDMSLKYLDVSKWDTSSATNMTSVFYGCASLEYIPIDNWDVSKVKTFSHMFADCFNLKSINFSKWDTSSVESFDALLNDCRSLITIDVSGLDTKTCKQFSQMFESCIKLEQIIGLETFDVSNANHYAFTETFHRCYNLKEINIGNWVATPDNTVRMFKDCRSVTRIDMSGFDMSNNLFKDEMFKNCECLIEVIGNI